MFEEHKEAQHLTGYVGDKRKQKAHIIVRRKHVGSGANDVGFLQKEDGSYDMIISEFDKNTHHTQGDNFTNKMKQIYGKHKALKKIKRMGVKISSQKVSQTKDGKLKIKLRVY